MVHPLYHEVPPTIVQFPWIQLLNLLPFVCQEPCISISTSWCFQQRHLAFKSPIPLLQLLNYEKKFIAFWMLFTKTPPFSSLQHDEYFIKIISLKEQRVLSSNNVSYDIQVAYSLTSNNILDRVVWQNRISCGHLQIGWIGMVFNKGSIL